MEEEVKLKYFIWIRKTYLYVLLIPAVLILAGAGLNQIVNIANSDRMPVLMNEVQLRNWIMNHPESISLIPIGMLDDRHCIMTKDTHLNFLADIIDVGDNTMSIGDAFIDTGEYIWTFAPFLWGFLITMKVTKYEIHNF